MILTEKQHKHHHYHLEKLININILQVKKYSHLIITYCHIFTYSHKRLHIFHQEKLFFKKAKTTEEQGEKQRKQNLRSRTKANIDTRKHSKYLIRYRS